MKPAIVIRGESPPTSPAARMRDDAAKERAMDAVCSVVAKEENQAGTVTALDRLLRYAATAFVHIIGHQRTVTRLQSLAGQIAAEAEGRV